MRAVPNTRRTSFALALLALAPVAASGQVASISGTVWDSISGGPLEDAAVFLWDTNYRAVSDSEGRYRIEDVPPGTYNLLFFHTRLGEMGVSPGPTRVTLDPGADREVHLATPSRSTMLRTQCLMEDRPDGSGALAGRVLDGSSGVELGGVAVSLSWHDELLEPPRTLHVRTGSDGWFRSCDIPADVAVLVSVDFFDRRNRRYEVIVEAGGYVEIEVPVYPLRAGRIRGHLLDATTGEDVEGAETWLRGTDHRTLSDGDGDFVFEGVPPGTYMLVTDHLAYGTKMDTLEIPTGQSLAVEMRLDDRPIAIAPITVTVEATRDQIDRVRGGIVITAEQVESVRQRSRDASDVIRSLHLPGVIVRHQTNGTICVGYITGQVRMNQTGCVEMMIYINGVRATDSDLALRLPPDAIESMVIYKPVEAGNLFGLGGGNGVWMIYTR